MQAADRRAAVSETDPLKLLPDRILSSTSGSCSLQEIKPTLVLDLDETLVHSVSDPVTNVTTTYERPGIARLSLSLHSSTDPLILTKTMDKRAVLFGWFPFLICNAEQHTRPHTHTHTHVHMPACCCGILCERLWCGDCLSLHH